VFSNEYKSFPHVHAFSVQQLVLFLHIYLLPFLTLTLHEQSYVKKDIITSGECFESHAIGRVAINCSRFMMMKERLI
jgi:hypothetical protein